jgi:beta-mannosidase
MATAPLNGTGHGHYRFRDSSTGEECWSLFQQSRCTAYTEFGIGSISNLDVLGEFLPEPLRFPPNPDTPWQTHHAFKAWEQDSHLYPDDIARYWGPSATLSELVEKGQRMAGDGLRGLFEEVRRQQPLASMALAWCFNEPWPTAANCSLVNWPCRPKAGLTAVSSALRPILASVRLKKYLWSPGELFSAELWMLCDGPDFVPSGKMSATLFLGDSMLSRLDWSFKSSSPTTNIQGPCLQCSLPAMNIDKLVLTLHVEGHPQWNSDWVLPYGSGQLTTEFRPSMNV